jgi:hypothetical protein
MGKERFASRAIDEDTKILSTEYLCQEGFEMLLEKWFWDGIKGKSLIFVNEQVEKLSDGEVEALSRKILHLDPEAQVTFKRAEGFSYLNFDFRT